MARIRSIKPEFWTDEDLSALPEATHLLAAALLNYADDEGYFNANPALIRAACSPIREPSVSIPESIRSLQTMGYIRLGTAADGKRIGHICKFAEHQRVSHPTPSKFTTQSTTWDSIDNAPEVLRSPQENFVPERNREQGTGKGKEEDLAARSADADSPPPVPPVAVAPLVERLGPPFITLTTNTGAQWPVYRELVDDFQQTYPGVDVEQEFRAMRAWLESNPKLRKTATGMKRFCNSWLGRAQNRAPRGRPPIPAPANGDPTVGRYVGN